MSFKVVDHFGLLDLAILAEELVEVLSVDLWGKAPYEDIIVLHLRVTGRWARMI